MPPPPPLLMDELVEEILLRLPPDSPGSLFSASLVCKRWCHIVSDPGFQRRFFDLHRHAPPMLGFIIYSDEFTCRDMGARFLPTTTSASGDASIGGLPHANLCGLRPCDSRHGRVLLLRTDDFFGIGIVVWNPITGEQLKLPKPPLSSSATVLHPYNWTAAVLCAATATSATCDHRDCHRRGHFIVVLVGDTRTSRNKYTTTYSSEAGVWSKPTVASSLPADESAGSIASWTRSALVGNTLYFVLLGYKSILEYSVCTRRTSVIKLPRVGENGLHERFAPIQLTTMEDGRLGFIREEDCSRLCLWRRQDEEPVGWVLSKVIELDRLLPLDDRMPNWEHLLVGSAEGVGTIFLKLKDELFMVDLRSCRVTKVYTHYGLRLAKVVVPYVNFCTPGTRR